MAKMVHLVYLAEMVMMVHLDHEDSLELKEKMGRMVKQDLRDSQVHRDQLELQVLGEGLEKKDQLALQVKIFFVYQKVFIRTFHTSFFTTE